MTKTLLFVHGTGVRGPAYAVTCALIERQIKKFELNVKLESCLWGDTAGAKLNAGGKSIPDYAEARGPAALPDDDQAALWSLLLQDPAFELRLLAELPAPPRMRVPNQRDPAEALLEQFVLLRHSDALNTLLADLNLTLGFDDAGEARSLDQLIDSLTTSTGYQQCRTCGLAGSLQHQGALARAVVASVQRAALDSGSPVLDRAGRDELVDEVKDMLGSGARGIGALLAAPLRGLALNLTTSHVRRQRGALTDSAFPAAGDILLYQARGQGIRDFIGRRIDQLKAKEVIILAHSLGGIACVELLAQHTPGHVKRLVTFGSQAPFFHELGALVTIEPGDSLPAHFPSWSNFYDLNDPLSYIASKVFSGDVSDYRVESGESFPASHSAYLHSTPFWQQLKALLHDA